MKEDRKALTVRLPVELYKAGARMARARHTSLNRILQESLRASLREKDEQRLYEAFSELGREREEAEVEFALSAQREVLTDGES